MGGKIDFSSRSPVFSFRCSVYVLMDGDNTCVLFFLFFFGFIRSGKFFWYWSRVVVVWGMAALV